MLSVVIPLYNAYSTLQSLLSDLNDQTLRDFEVIFVNDGSTDQTAEFIESELRNLNCSYKYLVQDNFGQEVARNRGIVQASGEFITFLDADDRISVNHLEALMYMMTELHSDIGITGYHVYSKPIQLKFQHDNIAEGTYQLLGHEQFLEEFIRGDIAGFLWNKIFVANMLKKCLKDDRLNYKEDTRMIARYAIDVKKCSIFSGKTYTYCISDTTAISRSTDNKMWKGWFATADELQHLAEGSYNRSLNFALRYWHTTIDLMSKTPVSGISDSSEVVQAITRLKRTKEILVKDINVYDRILLWYLLNCGSLKYSLTVFRLLFRFKSWIFKHIHGNIIE